MIDKYNRESMTQTEFVYALRTLVKQFAERREPRADDPETLPDWLDVFVAWLP